MSEPAANEAITGLPKLGLGLGLRNTHFEHILSRWPQIDWFEAISENFMDSGGRARHILHQVAERYPVALHGVSLSIGSASPLDFDYLAKLKKLANEINAVWVSDHLCWTGLLGVNSHDLLPVPLKEETLNHISQRVLQVQDFLGRPLILENPSSYITFTESTISEPDFLRALTDETGCGLLLDVNNVYVSCFNHDLDPIAYLNSFPFEKVVQMHLAGHQHCGTHIIDTHDGPVVENVWELFRLAWARSNGASTLLEWDGNIPPFVDCHNELLKAKQFMSGAVNPKKIRQKIQTTTDTIVSTPIDFLIPQVMDATREEENCL